MLFIVLVNLAFVSISSTFPKYSSINGTMNISQTVNVSRDKIFVLFYQYSEHIKEEHSLRVHIETEIAHNKSVLVIIKDDNEVVNTIKLQKQINHPLATADSTICPTLNMFTEKFLQNRTLSLEISSMSSIDTQVTVLVSIRQNFLLKKGEKRSLRITSNNSTYYLFQLDNDNEKVIVNVESEDEVCMTLSIQDTQCPVHDDPMSVKYSGVYQTVMKNGAMVVPQTGRPKFKNKSFFIVFVLNLNDEDCETKNKMKQINQNRTIRVKDFTFYVADAGEDYYLPIFGAIGFYLLFYFISPVISCAYKYLCLKNTEFEETEITDLERSLTDAAFYGTVEERADMKTLYGDMNSIINRYASNDNDGESTVSYNQTTETNDEYCDTISNVSSEQYNTRIVTTVFVSDLSKKKSEIVDRKYFLYLWYLIIISVFYSLPVVQLVINFQQTVDTTGNQDICYYNFRCTRPIYIFTAFNNIISNVGYVLLGILFTLITWRRHSLYNECKLRLNKKNHNLGIPQYYGLFYAMGLSLTMEGIMSACYHICPSRNNFQFDTAYMYILACICMIKIYQIRHPDINASAHSFFMTMAMIIFFGVVGVVYNKLIFWVIFTILYLLMSLFLICEIYFMGKWKLDFGLPIRIYIRVLNEKWKCFVPTHKSRMITLLFINAVNLAFALYGAIKQPQNFSSHFLAIFMTNLLLYFFVYIIMKIIVREPFYPLSIVYLLIGALCWGFSLYCFINYPTDWQESPAKSREYNKDCIFLGFYDIHDVWHFLSSLAMFFSFMALQNVDDSLFKYNRDKIPVF